MRVRYAVGSDGDRYLYLLMGRKWVCLTWGADGFAVSTRGGWVWGWPA